MKIKVNLSGVPPELEGDAEEWRAALEKKLNSSELLAKFIADLAIYGYSHITPEMIVDEIRRRRRPNGGTDIH